MVPEPTNLKHSNQSSQGGDHKRLDRELKEMTSALTYRLTNLHHMKKSSSSQFDEEQEDHGLGVITLAGHNVGATMRSELDGTDDTQGHGMHSDDQKALTTYTNSNFQAINNSIMLSGSYNCHDPGVHIETVEYVEPHEQGEKKHGKKGKKKKGKETSKSDKHSDGSKYESSMD